MKRISGLPFALFLLAVVGCEGLPPTAPAEAPEVPPLATGELSANALELSASALGGDLDLAGVGDVEVFGPGGSTTVCPEDGDDCLIFLLLSGNVSQVVDGIEVAIGTVEGNSIVDDEGEALCTLTEGDGPFGLRTYRLRYGDVVLTHWGKYAFRGDVTVPSVASSEFDNLIQNNVVYSFHKDQVFDGKWSDGNVLYTVSWLDEITVSKTLDSSSPALRLAIAGFSEGACGAFPVGDPGDQTPPADQTPP